MYIKGTFFNSFHIDTLAVASLDFYTPNLEALNSNIGLILERRSGKIRLSSGAFGLLHPYMKTFGFRE